MPKTTKPTFESLQAQLADPDYQVRKNTVRIIARYYRPQAVVPLLAALKDNRGEVRSQAAKTLGGLGDPRVVTPLLELLSDERSLVRLQALKAVYKLAPQRAVTSLLSLLSDKSSLVQGAAAKLLGQSGDARAIPALIPCLEATSTRVIGMAASALGNFRDPRAIGPLFATLEHEEAEHFAWYVINALRMIGGEQVFRGLLLLLKNPATPVQVRVQAAYALGEMKYSETAPELLPLLAERDRTLVSGIINALVNLGDPRAIEPLVSLIDDKDEQSCLRAVYALSRMQANHVIEKIIPLLTSPKVSVAIAATYFLARSKDKRALEPLLNVLDTPHEQFLFSIVRALGDLGYPEAFDALARVVRNSNNSWLRAVTIEALGKLGDNRIVELLLGRLDMTIMTQDLLYEPYAVIRALGEARDPRAIEPLQELLKRPSHLYLQEIIRHALVKLGASRPLSV